MTTATAKPEKVIKKQLVRIMPYINEANDNMGLTKYRMVLHDGATYREQLGYLGDKGVRRYLTGLNEHAPEIQGIKNPDDKNAAIRSIREKVAFLEKSFTSNELDIESENFWKDVKTVHPTNYEFWDGIFVTSGNEPVFLDPQDPMDLITICGIEAGGFTTIAKSFEDAKLSANAPKFYLDKSADTIISNNEVKKLKNRAFGILEKLNNSDVKKLFYVTKNVDKNSYQYISSTSPDTMYAYLNDFIEGKGWEKQVKKAANYFLSVAELSNEDLRLKAIIADAVFHKIIQNKADGLIYHTKTDSMLGRSVADVLSKMKEPLHADLSKEIQKEVEDKWKE